MSLTKEQIEAILAEAGVRHPPDYPAWRIPVPTKRTSAQRKKRKTRRKMTAKSRRKNRRRKIK